ncbi:BrnA antitoxin family protein [Paracraurococcus lichenis]|uniref:BrnA antitoxin family protein n=1 Tax=Paracraurococcus lichenis TaxID=3064888 RepID=A0ABT9E3E7_9PROT|nr:BrnA antitoxin family protein [Paracraurococcus sp. LOR1-02]MDO9710678.1 BrnA antitoxin family protein [Paracraurococcus sp. LOR1-02]
MTIPDLQRRRLERLAATPEETIDTDDILEVTDWSGAVRGGLFGPRKEAVTIRVDADVLAWFRNQAAGGSGYRTEINRVLRQHVERSATGKTSG